MLYQGSDTELHNAEKFYEIQIEDEKECWSDMLIKPTFFNLISLVDITYSITM